MNTQEKDSETLRFYLDFENDIIDVFDYNQDGFSEKEKENTDVIVEIDYESQKIDYGVK